ncbi:hypothetical protein CROQUDRAFT_79729 [Cronartium quercuum f. sp. fusiforme G11]|uniref:Thioredoxin domain-containing protein n=1 Tax=Cronartium quercuum f. sp. fusiforme G11 TaxID=708437 RepID=A0A9P6NJF1_9BASI|nr:hypothetical protein CROQUDRAFT_79729 [Cronartium quercuum f. sp. fusiforme G11]
MRPRSVVFLLLNILISLGQPFLSHAAPAAQQMHAGIQLSETNFDERVKVGLWCVFVEHYSPFCPHCKKFAPTWIKLCDLAKPFEPRGLHLAQINCIAQGDLCVKLGVEFYPQMKLFKDGIFIENYTGDRTPVEMNGYLDKLSAEYLANHTATATALPALTSTEPLGAIAEHPPATVTTSAPSESLAASLVLPLDQPPDTLLHTDKLVAEEPKPSEPHLVNDISSTHMTTAHPVDAEAHASVSRPVPNPDGKVLKLTSDSWASYTSAEAKTGPIFIKYFAPWCGHCQRLAPTWSQLAQALGKQVNIAEVNCEEVDLKSICRKEGVPGFPTLIFYQEGIKVEYPGSRALADMQAFAKKAAITGGAKDITPTDVEKVMSQEEVFFLYLYPESTSTKEIASSEAAKSFLGTALVFKSSSPSLFTRFGLLSSTPALLVFKDFDAQPWAISQASTSPKTFIAANSLSLLPELNAGNYEVLFKPSERKLVVLVCLASDDPNLRDELKIWAKQWRKSQQAREGRLPVDWVWTHADAQHADWLKSFFGISISGQVKDVRAESRLIVVDPLNHDFYDVQANGVRISWNPSSIFQTLVAVELGKGQPQVYGPFFERSFLRLQRSSSKLIANVYNHPLNSIAILVFLVLLMYRTCFFRSRSRYTRVVSEQRSITPVGHQRNALMGLKPSPKVD